MEGRTERIYPTTFGNSMVRTSNRSVLVECLTGYSSRHASYHRRVCPDSSPIFTCGVSARYMAIRHNSLYAPFWRHPPGFVSNPWEVFGEKELHSIQLAHRPIGDWRVSSFHDALY